MTTDTDLYGISGEQCGNDEKFGEEEIKQSGNVIALANSMFGHTKPLGGKAREILTEVMFASASDTPLIEGM